MDQNSERLNREQFTAELNNREPSDTELIPLVDAIFSVTGRRVALSTGLRWCSPGLRGVRLERQRVGGRWYTSVKFVKRFIAETNARAEQRANGQLEAVAGIAGRTDARQLEIDRAAELLREKVGA